MIPHIGSTLLELGATAMAADAEEQEEEPEEEEEEGTCGCSAVVLNTRREAGDTGVFSRLAMAT